MAKLRFSVLLSLVLCAACATQTKPPYPTGEVRKLNVDKRLIGPNVTPQTISPIEVPTRYNSKSGTSGLNH